MPAILFGSIGTLVETSEIQRKSFNKAFKHFGLDWYWNVGNYIEMIQDPGGIKRIKKYSNFKLSETNVKKIYDYKIKFFRQYAVNIVKPRKDILKIIKYAKKKNIKLGLITTTSKETIDIIIDSLSQYIDFNNFDLITYEKHSKKKKPYPDIYNFAANELKISKNKLIAIEDTPISYASSKSAKIKTLFFPGEYSVNKKKLIPSYKVFEEVVSFFEK